MKPITIPDIEDRYDIRMIRQRRCHSAFMFEPGNEIGFIRESV
jgi:hypothetical protein